MAGDKMKRRMCDCRTILGENLLVMLTLVGVVIGFSVGFGVRAVGVTDDAILWIGLPGELFMRMLKMMILPLIICSVISGTATLDAKSNGRISILAFIYIITTNALGSFLGIFLTLSIKPGAGLVGYKVASAPVTHMLQTQDIFADLIRNTFPDNIITASFQQVQTRYEPYENTIELTVNGTKQNKTILHYQRNINTATGMNVLGIVVCCVLFGIATSSTKENGIPFLKFFQSATEVILKVMSWLFLYSPVGVGSLIAASILRIDDLDYTFQSLGLFILDVSVGILIHQLLFIPLMYIFLYRKAPFAFLLSLGRVWITTFAAAATAIALPEMLHCAENLNKVDRRVSRFVLPFSVTLNAEGSAIYITSAVLFISQQMNIDLDMGKIIVIGVLTTVMTMALPSMPSSSIVTLIILLNSFKIPTESVAMLFAVEWFLDRIRSSSNAISHVLCSIFTYRFCKAHLLPSPAEPVGEIVPLIVTQPTVKVDDTLNYQQNDTDLNIIKLSNISNTQ